MTSSFNGRKKGREKTGKERVAEGRPNKNRNKENSAILVQEAGVTQKEEGRKEEHNGNCQKLSRRFLILNGRLRLKFAENTIYNKTISEAYLKYLRIKRQWYMRGNSKDQCFSGLETSLNKLSCLCLIWRKWILWW